MMDLTVCGVSKSFPGADALTGVSLALAPGTIHALVGENGAEKSTLLKIMAGIMRPDTGTVTLNDAPVYENPAAKVKIAFVPTRSTLFSTYGIRDLKKLFRSMYGTFDEERFQSVIDGLNIGKKRVRHLSTGMQMALSVALALAVQPDVLLLDEPFAGLDVLFRRRLIEALIDESASRDIAIFVSSHNVDELERLCDWVTFLSRGMIVNSGSVDGVKKSAVIRFQVVFSGDAPIDIASWPGVIAAEEVGRVWTISVRGDDEDVVGRLKTYDLLLLEELPVTLEDAFVYSYMQGGERQ